MRTGCALYNFTDMTKDTWILYESSEALRRSAYGSRKEVRAKMAQLITIIKEANENNKILTVTISTEDEEMTIPLIDPGQLETTLGIERYQEELLDDLLQWSHMVRAVVLVEMNQMCDRWPYLFSLRRSELMPEQYTPQPPGVWKRLKRALKSIFS